MIAQNEFVEDAGLLFRTPLLTTYKIFLCLGVLQTISGSGDRGEERRDNSFIF
jgi:hypothetical protein